MTQAVTGGISFFNIAAFDTFNVYWYVDWNHSGTVDDPSEILNWNDFGRPGDIPLAYPIGNGKGVYSCASHSTQTVLALFRPSTGEVFFDKNNDGLLLPPDGYIKMGQPAINRKPFVRQCNDKVGSTCDHPPTDPSTCWAQLGYYSSGTWTVCMDPSCSRTSAIAFGFPGNTPVPMQLPASMPFTWTSSLATSEAGQWFFDWNHNMVWDGCGVDRCIPVNQFNAADETGFAGAAESMIAAYKDGAEWIDLNSDFRWNRTLDNTQNIGNWATIRVMGNFIHP